MTRKERWAGSRRGGAALEGALVLPVLLTILLGIVEAGWLYHGQQALQRAVRFGCRAGAVAASPADPRTVAAAAIEADLTEAGFTCPTEGCDPQVSVELSAGERVLACNLTAPHRTLTHFIPGLEGLDLTAAARQRIERVDE